MGAYTPGLKVTRETLLTLERRLPLKGEVVVKKGDKVFYDTVVAKTQLPGRVYMLNVANKLGLDPSEVKEALFVKEGDPVEKGKPLAQNKGFFGYFKSKLPSPMTGTLESYSEVTGQVVLRTPPTPIEMKAYVEGIVDEVIPEEGVVVRTFGTFIQGILGIGGETNGPLKFATEDPAAVLTPSDITKDYQGCIIVVGSIATTEVIEKALECGVAGIIAGGMHDEDLRDFLGYDLGVAITGSEDKGLTLIMTEGFGPIRIAGKTFALLKENEGKRASISGATQIRAGVIRPEIIIPHIEKDWSEVEEHSLDLELAEGVPVRIIREPNFGKLATVTGLPVQPVVIPSGAKVRVAKVRFDDGEELLIPRANLELIEG